MKEWIECGVTAEGAAIRVEDINPWDHSWVPLKKSVTLPHPSYMHQMHEYEIYAVDFGGKKITFAAGELSPNVWGFYVPAATAVRF